MNIQGNTLVKGVDEPHVVIPEGVEIIGDYAFHEFDRLTSVVFPSTLISIGVEAFRECDRLTKVDLSQTSLTSIGKDAFMWTGLTSVMFPSSLSFIGVGAFHGCDEFTMVDLSQTSLTSIGEEAFRDCTSLTRVTLPEGLTSIGNGAFHKCVGLTSVVFPSTLTSIGKHAFGRCSGLTGVVLPEGVSIGKEAFIGCSGLNSVLFPSTLTSIGEGAFRECTSLTRVTLHEGLNSIGDYAFFGCTGLTEIKLSSSLTSIGDDTFRNCTELTEVDLSATELTTIRYGTFHRCRALTSVVFPERLTRIGERAFYECTGLRVLVPPCQVHPTAFTDCLLVLNVSGRNIPGSIVLRPRIIGLRQRLLAIWSATVRRQGRLRQSSRGYRAKNLGASQGFVELYSREELLEVVRVWREIKQTLAGVTRRGEVVEFLFAKIIEGGRRFMTMKSYLNQPEETKVFKKVLEDLGIREPFTESGEEKEIHAAKRMKRLHLRF